MRRIRKSIGIGMGLVSGLAVPSAHAIQGGAKVAATNPIAQVTVAVNVNFAGIPGQPVPSPPDHSLKPCTGIIFDDDLVLTAAHCIRQYSVFHLIFDVNAGNAAAVTRDVIAYDVPLDFNYNNASPSGRSDIAMLYFQGGLPAGYTKAALLLDEGSLKAGSTALAVGYGPCPSASACTLTEMTGAIPRDDYWPTEIQVSASASAYPTSADAGGPAFILNGSTPEIFGIDNGSWSELIEVYSGIGAHSTWMQQAAARLRATQTSQGPGWGH